MSSAICFNLDQSKILSSGNGLKINIAKSRKESFTYCRVFIGKAISDEFIMDIRPVDDGSSLP